MKPNEIQQLIGAIAASGLEEVNIESEDIKISVKRSPATTVVQTLAAAPVAAPVFTPAPAVAAAPVAATPVVAAAPVAEAKPAAENTANQVTIKSPMIGTFYRSSKPEVPSFVNVGDEIKPGQTVCIVEAMKLFNEIESEISGRIVKILVENASPVEYDQPLFVVEKL
ncbi:acetyl-CoA carboxylase biotin carboxyl carrier protein [Flexibacter flexilis DSM 6793]|uniref:Biotin carboxyl carrier protein of acetyl-CoA carboxylase n=1 Tax=Flexibacter flexilis DSM 6793 TaxID=927664 RepID=A0A1I1FVY6_9BACT|nr:acetyl-CoA carboxylase biotin carboxyl carrier protein [Flexibacter flexilis]SFC03719.1 acetyl-CoA carboxylase biotin carboxyl carrier protein [Flexibacter flexilis DSM 6793]